MEAYARHAENFNIRRVDILFFGLEFLVLGLGILRLVLSGQVGVGLGGQGRLPGPDSLRQIGFHWLGRRDGLFFFGQRLLVFAHKRLHPLLQGY